MGRDWGGMVLCVCIGPRGCETNCLTCEPSILAFVVAAVVVADLVSVAELLPIPAIVISNSALALACLSISPLLLSNLLADPVPGWEVVEAAPASEALVPTASSVPDKAATFVRREEGGA